MLKSAFLSLALFTLAACNPFDFADQAAERAARAVVLPVLSQELPAPAAEKGTDCIIAAATGAELVILARDLGVSAGPQTVMNIKNIALRPQVVSCFAAASVPPLKPKV